MLAAAVTDHLFWITSRAAGTVALLLASVAVGLGLLHGRASGCKGRGPDLRATHEALSLATIVAHRRARRRRCSATASCTRASPTFRSRSSAAT